jgi:hypothetical protein
MDVVVEELCIMLVAKTPMSNPTNGLDVVVISDSAKPSPNPLKAWLIRLMLNRNKYRKNKTLIILSALDGSVGLLAFNYFYLKDYFLCPAT